MAKGVTVKITRIIETRARRADDARVTIWTGTCWRSARSFPRDPEMAKYWGSEPEIVTTKIKFSPPGVLTEDALLYRKTLLPKMRAMGIIK